MISWAIFDAGNIALKAVPFQFDSQEIFGQNFGQLLKAIELPPRLYRREGLASPSAVDGVDDGGGLREVRDQDEQGRGEKREAASNRNHDQH